MTLNAALNSLCRIESDPTHSGMFRVVVTAPQEDFVLADALTKAEAQAGLTEFTQGFQTATKGALLRANSTLTAELLTKSFFQA